MMKFKDFLTLLDVEYNLFCVAIKFMWFLNLSWRLQITRGCRILNYSGSRCQSQSLALIKRILKTLHGLTHTLAWVWAMNWLCMLFCICLKPCASINSTKVVPSIGADSIGRASCCCWALISRLPDWAAEGSRVLGLPHGLLSMVKKRKLGMREWRADWNWQKSSPWEIMVSKIEEEWIDESLDDGIKL